MKRTPKGVLNRMPQDWSISRMSGAFLSSAAVGGQFSYARLFNNATDGSWLWCYGFTFRPSANNGVFFETGNGTEGSAAGVIQPNGLNPLSQGLPGKTFTFSNAACIATEIGHMGVNTTGLFWPYDYPFAVIPPNYSLYVHTDGFAVALEATVWYAALPAPG